MHAGIGKLKMHACKLKFSYILYTYIIYHQKTVKLMEACHNLQKVASTYVYRRNDILASDNNIIINMIITIDS